MKHVLRRLAASPGFTITALITLALGIGVNTSMFSVLRSIFLRTLPFPGGERLVRVFKTIPQGNANPHSPANFLDQREQNTVFTHMAALAWSNFNLSEPGQPAERLRGMDVTTDFFPLLGVAPAIGRTFVAEEVRAGTSEVVVLSHEFWISRFGRDPTVIGRPIRLGGQPATVIGVMPAGFNDPLLFWTDRRMAGYGVYRRPACDTTLELAHGHRTAQTRCFEHAIRAALGASRARLIRDVLAESLLLALAGGALGVLVALWCNDALGSRIFYPPNQVGIDLPIDLRALCFALLVSTATGITFGLLPAWLASRVNVSDALKQGARGITAGRSQHRVRHTLIVAEVALALVLLASAAFFVGGLRRFAERELGWDADRLLTAQVSIGTTAEARATQEQLTAHRVAMVERWEERVARIPGVERVAFARHLPTWSYGNDARFAIDGRPPASAGLEPVAFTPAVTPGFFTTLGLRVIEGRGFTAADRADQPAVTVINERMARTLWPGESPIGQRIGSPDPANRMWREVVGVVSDARSILLGEVGPPFQMYRPFAQATEPNLTLTVRTRFAPEAIAPELRRAALEIDPAQPVYSISTVRSGIAQSLVNLELAGWLLAGFAFLGVGIAALGIYAVIAYNVVQRTPEIGIRIALGAQMRDVLALVVGQGVRLAFIGVAIGLAGAWGVARLLAAILPAVPITTLSTTAWVTGFLVGIATLASWLPARRAARVDPLVALRAE